MDVLNELVGGRGCAADGTVALSGANPLSNLVDRIMDGGSRSQVGNSMKSNHGPLAIGRGMHEMEPVNSIHTPMMNGMAAFAAHQGHMMMPPPHYGHFSGMKMLEGRNWNENFEQGWGQSARPMHIGQFDGAWEEANMMQRQHMHQKMAAGGNFNQIWEKNADNMTNFGDIWNSRGAMPNNFEASMEASWRANSHHVGNFDDAWVQSEPNMAQMYPEQQRKDEFNDIWEGKESSGQTMESAWDGINAAMEGAWEEAKLSGNPDFTKIWEEEDVDKEELEKMWARTSAQLESMGAQNAEGALDAYTFNADNAYLDEELYSDVFATGMLQFNEGNIADAVLCFEAELQRHPDNSEAWKMLGQSHAENDQDRLAIGCLERSVDTDPYNLEALLALGVSYLNELDSVRALKNLKSWVENNPKYTGLEFKMDEYSDGSLMDEVMQLMHSAEQWDQTDADVKVVLGVLFNVSRDYDSAVFAFKAALNLRPEDYSLWNKLGATLANSNRSDEAIPAYKEALQRKTKYARAWLNMGISNANLNAYNEAASCYLRALNLNPAAKHIWSYLRIVFTCMERYDLVQKAGSENVHLFLEEFLGNTPSFVNDAQFEGIW